MTSLSSVLLTLALGMAMGAGIVLLLTVASRRGADAAELADRSLPDGVTQTIDALDAAGIVLDTSNTVRTASAAATSMGLVHDDALVHPQLAHLVNRVRRTGEPVTEDLELARGPFGGVQLHVRVRVTRLGTRDVLLIADDHTDAHRLEEVRRDFIANISHELKTPISAVGLLAEAVAEAADDPDQVRRFAAQLTAETDRLGRITRDVIELTRLESTDALGGSRLLGIRDVINTAIEQNRVAAAAGGVTLVVRGGKKAQVNGDEMLLTAAVHNLIANAIQYSPAGSRVGIGVKSGDGLVEIAVTDQGEGIPEQDLDRVFERFFRVDDARSRHTGGSGLGLAIVKHAVQNHGGDVRVWSVAGRGSTFTIRLPLAAPAEPEGA